MHIHTSSGLTAGRKTAAQAGAKNTELASKRALRRRDDSQRDGTVP